jgi:hypothetical protein
MVSVNLLSFAILQCEKFLFPPTSPFYLSSKRSVLVYMKHILLNDTIKIVGDDTTALESVLKADVWRDHLLKQEKELNQRLSELEAGDDRTAEEAKEELSTRLGEVHARLAEMDAESGPARAALLLAGWWKQCFVLIQMLMPWQV